MLAHYLFSHGKVLPVYVLHILCGVLGFCLNTILFLKDYSNYGLLMFHLLSVWQIVMNTRGILRINQSG